jgi:hypothetical protein
LLAEVAGKTGSVDPLDTGKVADFNVIDEFTLGDYFSSAFVATDKR